jgi:hypothetical protein
MDSRVVRLRISYWAGAIADGLAVIPMLSPEVAGFLLEIPDFDPGIEYRYAMGLGLP